MNPDASAPNPGPAPESGSPDGSAPESSARTSRRGVLKGTGLVLAGAVVGAAAGGGAAALREYFPADATGGTGTASLEAEECVDLQKVFPEYEKIAHARSDGFAGGSNVSGKDWIHIDTVQVVDDIMYLSAHETSTIIALKNAVEAGSEPTILWMIGVQELWAGTAYEDLFLSPVGSPNGNAGQHTVTRIDDGSLEDGQFYLEMFDNNYWFLGTRDDADRKDIGPDNASIEENVGTSQILRYLVDENGGTFTEDMMVEVPFSSVVSSVLRQGDSTVRAEYRLDSTHYAYRVDQDPFEGFWYEY